MAKIGSKIDELKVPLLSQEKAVVQFTPRLFVCSSSKKSKQRWSEDFYWQFKSDIDALNSEWVASVPVVSITQYAVDEEGVIASIDKVNAVFPKLIENCSGVTHEGSVLVGLTKDEVSAALCKKELWHKMQHLASCCAPRDLKDSQSVFWKVAALRRMQETWQVYNLCEDIETACPADARLETYIHLVPPFQYGHEMLAQQKRQ
jgi:hypothetical protein